MSFTYDPYKHIEIINANDGRDLFYWYCRSCGGSSVIEFSYNDSISRIKIDFEKHIRIAHRKTHNDFVGWPKT